MEETPDDVVAISDTPYEDQMCESVGGRVAKLLPCLEPLLEAEHAGPKNLK
jgi:hypothetical protein